jgi:hypothetical protein
MVEMDYKTQGMIEVGAALVVLVTAMVSTTLSLGIAVLALVCMAAYKFLHAQDQDKAKK